MHTQPHADARHPAHATHHAPHAHDDNGMCVFTDIHLNVGDTVFLDFSGARAHGRASSTVLGWREGVSVMVTQPVTADKQLQLFEGETVTLRVFTGRSAYAFKGNVLKTNSLPFPYVHLSFPKWVQAVEIRKSPRSRVDMPATFSVDGQHAGLGIIVDLGTAGALLDTGEVLDTSVESLQLAVSFELHDVPVSLDLHANILGMKGYSSQGEQTSVQYRLAFDQLKPNDRLVLSSLLWFQMYEHPDTIV
jgi:hypothetical protein